MNPYYVTCECGHGGEYHINLRKHWWNRSKIELLAECQHTIFKQIKNECDEDYCKHVNVQCKCKKFKFAETI